MMLHAARAQSLGRTVCFGYRPTELIPAGYMADPPPSSDSLKVRRRKTPYEPMRRDPGRFSLGCHLEGAALPHPDHYHPDSVILGIHKRFGHKPPDVDMALFDELMEFVHEYMQKKLVPLPPDESFDFEEWLVSTHYPEWRRDELRAANLELEEGYASSKEGWEKLTRVQSFIKDENYPTWKHLRPINSRTDHFKCLVGPLFRKIEKSVFRDSSFIKKIPRPEWPDYIERELSGDGEIYISDYTSYEALFEVLMEVELALYNYMLQYHPEYQERANLIDTTNRFWFRHVAGSVWRKRMSGEMNTSLGNGWTTHVVVKFIVHKLYGADVKVLQEGDDTIFLSPGPVDDSWFTRLGLEVKLERVERLSVGQFCQLLFDPLEKIVVRNPVEYIVGFAWAPCQYINSKRHDWKLLVSKAMSCVAQYPKHPVLISFASWILRVSPPQVTPTVVLRFLESRKAHFDAFSIQKLIEGAMFFEERKLDGGAFSPEPPGINTRYLIEDLYSISVSEQLKIEEWFDHQDTLCPIPLGLLEQWLAPEWIDNWSFYVRDVDVRQPSFDMVDVGPTSTI